MSGSIEAVVFDVGGVLLDWNPRHLYRKLFDDEAEMERFLAEICTPEWHAAHDRGVPMGPSCAALAAEHPEYAAEIMAWSQRSEEMLGGVIEGSVAILQELQSTGVPCYALSNIEAETYPLRRARYPFLRSFKGTVVSAYEGVAKPDREIFRRLLGRYGLSACRTLMIDDNAANVAAAAGLGMQTFRFESATGLRRFLEGESLL